MPQMMPINWIILMIIFIIIFMLFQIMNYYIFMKKYNKNENLMTLSMKNFNWKW